MKIIQSFIDINKFSRDGRKIKEMKAVVYHWTANPMVSAEANRTFFQKRKESYGGAHFIIGLQGEVLQCIPEDEVALHCGTDRLDPKSGLMYTDKARELFGPVATSSSSSPNHYSLGIELCPTDAKGNFTRETLASALELGLYLCNKYTLDPMTQITTHNEIVGWKDCPLLWTDHPQLFEDFKLSLKNKL